MDDESLRTFMTEVENVVNSRPLTTDDLCDPFVKSLTPNHLLTLKRKLLLPSPGNFQRADVDATQRWRRVQQLSNEFWHKWRRQYLHLLQTRQKWMTKRRNLRKGDVVLLVEDSVPRHCRKLARVVSVYPSPDKLVRKVRLRKFDGALDPMGKSLRYDKKYFNRPISKFVLLFPNKEAISEDN